MKNKITNRGELSNQICLRAVNNLFDAVSSMSQFIANMPTVKLQQAETRLISLYTSQFILSEFLAPSIESAKYGKFLNDAPLAVFAGVVLARDEMLKHYVDALPTLEDCECEVDHKAEYLELANDLLNYDLVIQREIIADFATFLDSMEDCNNACKIKR